MPRNLSPLAISSAQALETDQAWLVLLELNHPTLNQAFRVVNNTDPITSNGLIYTPYPFDIVFAQDDAQHLPEISLTIDNVDRFLIESIRKIDEPPTVNIKLVLSSQPDIVEIDIEHMTLREVSFNAYTITGKLYVEDLLNQRYPKDLITIAAGYHGLFK